LILKVFYLNQFTPVGKLLQSLLLSKYEGVNMRSFQCTSLQAASLFMQQCWRVCTPFSPPLVMSLAAKNPRHVKCVFVHDINYLSNKLCFSHHFRCRMLSISPLFAGRWKSIGTERGLNILAIVASVAQTMGITWSSWKSVSKSSLLCGAAAMLHAFLM